MTATNDIRSFAPHWRDSARALAWVCRWALVLLLTVDQVGAHLHDHRHVPGVDGLAMHPSHAGLTTGELHAEDLPDIRTDHGALAVRNWAQTSPLRQIVDDRQPSCLAAASAPAVATAAQVRTARPWAPFPGEPPQAYRALPPAGRAPPLHA